MSSLGNNVDISFTKNDRLTSSAQGLSLVHSRLQGLGHVRKGASLRWIKHAALIIHLDHLRGCAARHIQPPPLETDLGQNLHHR